MDVRECQTYRDLDVWRESKSAAVELYRATQGFPKEEAYGLTSQIRRAATSIPANIAEGWARKRSGDYLRFLHIAAGSLAELETHIEIARDLGFLPPEGQDDLGKRLTAIGKMLYGLIRVVAARPQ